MLALILSVLTLSGAHPPVLWTCFPGKLPGGAPSNCERVHFTVLYKFPAILPIVARR